MRSLELFIAGQWRQGGGQPRPVLNPATEQPVAQLATADAGDLDAALAAAAAALPGWTRTPALLRGEVLARAAALLRERVGQLARELTEENGKTLAESTGEIGRAIETLGWCAEEAGRIEGRIIAGRAPGQRRSLVPQPAGVVPASPAWNSPAVLVARKLGAALAAGCSVVIKAAEEAPGIAIGIARALADAGLPPGTVNLVFGDPPAISRHLLASPIVRKLTFTGSTAVGKELARLAADDLKRCTFELGGPAPVIVAPDADLELALAGTLAGKFGTARQGSEQGVKVGPLANPRRLAAMERLTADALAHGARLVTGGKRLPRSGWFFPPTVLAEVPEAAAVMNEEPFGPIAALAPVADLDEAYARANRLPYGFAAYLFTGALKTAAEAVERFKAGNIGVNQMAPSLPDAPVGGLGDSGYGYEGGREGMAEFLHWRLVNQAAV